MQTFVRSIAGHVDFTLCARLLGGVTVLAHWATVSGRVLGAILPAKHCKTTHSLMVNATAG
ncbi:MAG: hypothetical protein ABI180_08380 [Microcoleus sp.]